MRLVVVSVLSEEIERGTLFMRALIMHRIAYGNVKGHKVCLSLKTHLCGNVTRLLSKSILVAQASVARSLAKEDGSKCRLDQ